MEKNGEGAAPPATPVKRTKCFRAKKKVFFNPSRQISTRPQCVLQGLCINAWGYGRQGAENTNKTVYHKLSERELPGEEAQVPG